jgi:putative nucleotidyltransferase with HDIG domain
MRVGAILHDVGKLVVPSDILNKPGPLTPEERAVMERHAEAGVALLADIDFPEDVLPMVRNHHERWDGSGYPDRLGGDRIALAARILCIADVYDALTTTRPYRPAYPRERAMEIMRSEAGRLFDPALLAEFLTLAERGLEARPPVPARRLTPRGGRAVAAPPGAYVAPQAAPAARKSA